MPVHWLSLVSGSSGTGATYVSPVAIEAGQPLLQSVVAGDFIPARQGYVFKGWYLDVENEGGNDQNGTGTQLTDENGSLLQVQDNDRGIQSVGGEYLLLAADNTVYARWEAESVGYSVVVWMQRAGEAESYDWAESRTSVS